MTAESLPAMAPVALARRELLLRVVADGRRIGFQLSNAIDDAGARLKKAGAVWFAPRRLWVVREDTPARCAAWLRRQFPDVADGVDLDAAGPLISAACAAPQPDYYCQLLDVQVFALESGGHAVSFAYDLPAVDAMRELQGRFHKFAAAWEVRRPLPVLIKALAERAGIDPNFIFVHDRPVVLEDLVAASKSEAPITVPAASPHFGEGSAEGDDSAGQGF